VPLSCESSSERTLSDEGTVNLALTFGER